MPMVLSQVHNNWDKHWEGFLFVGFKNVEEIVILKEAHSSISNLQMDATNALDDSFEKFWDQVFDFVNLAYF